MIGASNRFDRVVIITRKNLTVIYKKGI